MGVLISFSFLGRSVWLTAVCLFVDKVLRSYGWLWTPHLPDFTSQARGLWVSTTEYQLAEKRDSCRWPCLPLLRTVPFWKRYEKSLIRDGFVVVVDNDDDDVITEVFPSPLQINKKWWFMPLSISQIVKAEMLFFILISSHRWEMSHVTFLIPIHGSSHL